MVTSSFYLHLCASQLSKLASVSSRVKTRLDTHCPVQEVQDNIDAAAREEGSKLHLISERELCMFASKKRYNDRRQGIQQEVMPERMLCGTRYPLSAQAVHVIHFQRV
ncbi:hypothetical protein NDU88_000570 [Pleurodeles waltl]|uniref:Uncharacterized protein n=1 Tax=Pleurodeles waltl TaxID=8319 RepID=A0AAV7P4J3_PLEWA|nr:hypothetical protein NDU88_000570 [Pleurodeles waltl]